MEKCGVWGVDIPPPLCLNACCSPMNVNTNQYRWIGGKDFPNHEKPDDIIKSWDNDLLYEKNSPEGKGHQFQWISGKVDFTINRN